VSSADLAGAPPSVRAEWLAIALGLIASWGWLGFAQFVGSTVSDPSIPTMVLFYLLVFAPLVPIALAAGRIARIGARSRPAALGAERRGLGAGRRGWSGDRAAGPATARDRRTHGGDGGVISPFRIEDSSATHVGHVRKENEDSHYSDARAGVWLVADGMGGHANGKHASEAIAHALSLAELPHTLDEAAGAVADAIHLANRAIREHSQENDVQMGSTAVALVVRGDEFAVLWAGDSRAYLYRHGALIPLTRDHTQVQEMVDRGLLAPHEADDHPMKHVLSRAVGVQDSLEIDAIRDRLESRDLFVLCSDGLYGIVSEPDIAAILHAHGPAASEALVEACLAGGATDNVTVTVVGVTEPTLLVLGGAPA